MLAQWKRVGLITRRTLDRNEDMLVSFSCSYEDFFEPICWAAHNEGSSINEDMLVRFLDLLRLFCAYVPGC